MSKRPFSVILILFSLVSSFLIAGCAASAADFLEDGNRLFAEKNVEKAIIQYSRAIEADPLLAEAFYRRGLAYREMGEFVKAKDDMDSYINLEPGVAKAYFIRSLLESLVGDVKLAMADMDTAINLDGNTVRNLEPGMGIAYYKLGVAYFDSGRFLLAQAFLGGAIRLVPEMTDAYRMRADLYIKTGYYDLAIIDLTRLIKMDAASAALYVDRGNVYIVKGEHEKAIADFQKAIASTTDTDIIEQAEQGLRDATAQKRLHNTDIQ